MEVVLIIISSLVGLGVGLLIVFLLMAWWYKYGKRVVICRRKGHEYSRPDKPYFTPYGPREGWSYDPKYCWYEARSLPESEWDPQREAIWQKMYPWLYEGPLVP